MPELRSFIFLGVDDGDGGHVYDFLDLSAPVQNVDGPAHSHEDRTKGFAPADLCHQFASDIGGGEVGEDQDVGAALKCAEGIRLLDRFPETTRRRP